MGISRRFFLKGSAATAFAGAFGLPARPESEAAPVTGPGTGPVPLATSSSSSVIEASVQMHNDFAVGKRDTTVQMRCFFDPEDPLLEEVQDMFRTLDARYVEFVMPGDGYSVCGEFRIMEISMAPTSPYAFGTYEFTAVTDKPVTIRVSE